ncbi:MAG: hypothetical protein GY809_15945, partial [Planctomycetes bacterium]|nr:hypothetical protein [Planctomycetota bacterium]
MTRQKLAGLLTPALLVLTMGGCQTVPETQASRNTLSSQVDRTVAVFKNSDRTIEGFFDSAYGYAVLPRVANGAFLVGGAHGQGHVFEQGKMIGYCSANQASIGASI